MTPKCGLDIIRAIKDFTLGLEQSNKPIMTIDFTMI